MRSCARHRHPDHRFEPRSAAGSGRADLSRAALAVPALTASVETLSRSKRCNCSLRARNCRNPASLTERDAPAIAELPRAVEGIRSRWSSRRRGCALSLQEINKRLHNRFTRLTGGGRVLLERQQTLRALVAWSPISLSDNEKLVRASGGLRRRLRSAGRRGGLRSRSRPARGCPRPRAIARRQVALSWSAKRTANRGTGCWRTLREFGLEGLGKRGEQAGEREAPLRPLSAQWPRPTRD